MSVDCYIKQLLKSVNIKSEKILVIIAWTDDFIDFTDFIDRVNRTDKFNKVIISHTR